MISRHSLEIDPQAESERIGSRLVHTVRKTLRKNGVVVGISGGIDSSVVLALAVQSLGADRVRAIMMPEKESEGESESLARDLAAHYGVEPVLEDLTGCLEGLGCYRRRDAAIRRVFPEYDAQLGYKSKITLPSNLLDRDVLNVFSLDIITPGGEMISKALPPAEFREIVAASNFKQRARMMTLYYHAELNNYAVVGTANKNEHDMGFFVKYGDGGVDVKPIEHLFKTQIYQLAEYLDVPEEIRRRTPTTDTYSAPATQQEFFFRLPFETMDLIWWAMENGVPAAETARAMDLSEEQVTRAQADFVRKKRATEYLRLQPVSLAGDGSDEPARVTSAAAHSERHADHFSNQ
jgi:NAD+ synthase